MSRTPSNAKRWTLRNCQRCGDEFRGVGVQSLCQVCSAYAGTDRDPLWEQPPVPAPTATRPGPACGGAQPCEGCERADCRVNVYRWRVERGEHLYHADDGR